MFESMTFSNPVIFLLDALLGGGVCIEAADFAESTVRGPSSPEQPSGFVERILLAVSVSCSEPCKASTPPVRPETLSGSRRWFEGVLKPNR